MRLLIISHTAHYLKDGKIAGWGPTVREIDYLARIFDEIIHIAYFYDKLPPPNSLAYTSPNVHVVRVTPSGGPKVRDKINVLLKSIEYLRVINRWLRHADVVHIRSPANISLMALFLLSFKRKPSYRWIKYAGNWRPEGKEPWSYRFQRWWLKHNFHRGVVTVNGRWPEQPQHIYSFINPSFLLKEVENASAKVSRKKLVPPYNFLFVGRIETAKGVGRAIRIIKVLVEKGIPLTFHLIGDGIDREKYITWVRETGLNSHIFFHGEMLHSVTGRFYEKAHFLLLPTSASEGWPKVISEAMAYGVVPLVGAVSSIPQILGEIGTGRAIHPDDIDGYVRAIRFYFDHPEIWEKERDAGLKAAPKFTYEAYLDAVRSMFKQAWNLELIST